MANAITVVNDARYDLRDYGTGVNIGNTEILNYLNRVIGMYGRELCNRNSEYTHAETSTSTSASTAYITMPTRAHSIRSVWIGTDKKEQLSSDEMAYKSKWYSGQAEPQFWCVRGANIHFQQQPGQDASSSDFVVNIHYRELPAAITSLSSSAMPWGSIYDQHITQSLVQFCRAKKDDTIEQPDQYIAGQVRHNAAAETIARKKKSKGYYLDF